ncbi:MAG: aminotransferase class V-fold PLP-dependent enzyme [Saprospiraceae bacterium]|nr:aminotransferase class V-fold PLP-dependent enzyme [Saprospiraceae bacterium]
MKSIEEIRRETPGCIDKIFLNSAGSSLVPDTVFTAMNEYLQKERMIGGYQLAQLCQNEIDDFYIQASKLLQCPSENIAFMTSATDAYAKAVSSIALEKDDYILTSDDDYISNYLLFFSLQKKFGIQIIRARNASNGDIDMDDFEKKMKTYKPKVVSVTHVPTNSGKIQPVEKIGDLCQKNDVWYIVDACQSVGQMNVDVTKIKCDFLSATGRKFLRGPRGTGLLYVSEKALERGLQPLFIDMRGAEWNTENSCIPVSGARRFEYWEVNYANLIGLTEAIKYALTIGMDDIRKYNSGLRDMLMRLLGKIPDIRLTEDGSIGSSIITFTSEKWSLKEIQDTLTQAGISYSTSFRHFALIDFNKKKVDWAIRLSPHYFNKEEEILKVCEIIQK